MNLEKLDGLKIYILESLHSGDRKTGEDLKDSLRQIWYEQNISNSDCQYYRISNQDELYIQLKNIESEVLTDNKWPIVQFECHGSSAGIHLSSNEQVKWEELFNHLRPINIASKNFLLLTLSMCNGECVIRYIDPKQRAPFRAVVGPVGKAFPDDLVNSWNTFYTKFIESLTQDYGLHKLVQKSGLIYYNQDFIFDVHFDLVNKDPELFTIFRNKEMYEMYKAEGVLEMSPEIYRLWVAKEQAKIKEKYRNIFCFDDLKSLCKNNQ